METTTHRAYVCDHHKVCWYSYPHCGVEELRTHHPPPIQNLDHPIDQTCLTLYGTGFVVCPNCDSNFLLVGNLAGSWIDECSLCNGTFLDNIPSSSPRRLIGYVCNHHMVRWNGWNNCSMKDMRAQHPPPAWNVHDPCEETCLPSGGITVNHCSECKADSIHTKIPPGTRLGIEKCAFCYHKFTSDEIRAGGRFSCSLL